MFEQSRLKIERANHHINDLDIYIDSILKNHLYTLSIENDTHTGVPGLVCRVCDTPWGISLIIGDAVHNLRSALDILYCDILRHEGRAVDKYSRWPFKESRTNLEDGFKGRKEQARPSSGVIDLIVNAIQTYRGGRGDVLYALHDLDIEDKHMLMLPTISITRIQDIEVIDGNGTRMSSAFSASGGHGAPTNLHFGANSSAGIREITNHGKATFDVFFGKGVFHGQPVVPTLYDLSRRVSETVEIIEHYLNTNAGR